MAIVNLTQESSIDTSYDGVVIQKMIEDVPGGRTIDVSGLETAYGDILRAGHPIFIDSVTKEFKAQPVTSGVYIAPDGNFKYYGILYVSVAKDKALGSIMVRGTVNQKAATESGLPPYLTPATETALNLIRFVEA